MATWDGDGVEDWEYELTRPDGFPQIAIGVGVVVLVLVAVATFWFVPIETVASHMFGALGIGLLAAGVVFAAAWWPSLRHASIGWRIGGGVAFLGVGLMTVAVGMFMADMAVREDVMNVQRIRIDTDGEPTLPSTVRRGPITNATMAFLHDALVERKRRIAVAHDLGLDRLADAGAVTAEPGLIKDCGRFARAAPQIDTSFAAFMAKVDNYRNRVRSAIRDQALRDSLIRSFDEGFGGSMGDAKATNDLLHRLYDQAGELCTALGTLRWKARGRLFQFSSSTDLAAFNTVVGQWNALLQENQILTARGQSRMRESGMFDDNFRF